MGTLFHSRQTAAALVWDGLPSVLGEFVLQSRNCRPFSFASFDLFKVAGGAFLPQCLNYAAPLWFGFHLALRFHVLYATYPQLCSSLLLSFRAFSLIHRVLVPQPSN